MRAACLALMLAAAPAAAQDMVQFQSPSGNIHCLLFGGDGDWQGARCDILETTTLSFARPPADCDLDWGHAFEVGRGSLPAQPVCAGDTVASPDAPVLPYGASTSFAGITCTSETTGVTCTNAAGRGFSLAKARQRVF